MLKMSSVSDPALPLPRDILLLGFYLAGGGGEQYQVSFMYKIQTLQPWTDSVIEKVVVNIV